MTEYAVRKGKVLWDPGCRWHISDESKPILFELKTLCALLSLHIPFKVPTPLKPLGPQITKGTGRSLQMQGSLQEYCILFLSCQSSCLVCTADNDGNETEAGNVVPAMDFSGCKHELEQNEPQLWGPHSFGRGLLIKQFIPLTPPSSPDAQSYVLRTSLLSKGPVALVEFHFLFM